MRKRIDIIEKLFCTVIVVLWATQVVTKDYSSAFALVVPGAATHILIGLRDIYTHNRNIYMLRKLLKSIKTEFDMDCFVEHLEKYGFI